MAEYVTTVCPSCPWRRGATADAIPGFDVCRARGLRRTVGDGSDAFRTIMACHGSDEGRDRPCGGYLAVVGWTNLAVRMAVIEGRITMPDIDGVELVSSFDEMLDQVDPQDRHEPATGESATNRRRTSIEEGEARTTDVRVHIDGPPLEPPMAVLTRPQDWAPRARRILWPDR